MGFSFSDIWHGVTDAVEEGLHTIVNGVKHTYTAAPTAVLHIARGENVVSSLGQAAAQAQAGSTAGLNAIASPVLNKTAPVTDRIPLGSTAREYVDTAKKIDSSETVSTSDQWTLFRDGAEIGGAAYGGATFGAKLGLTKSLTAAAAGTSILNGRAPQLSQFSSFAGPDLAPYQDFFNGAQDAWNAVKPPAINPAPIAWGPNIDASTYGLANPLKASGDAASGTNLIALAALGAVIFLGRKVLK